MKQIKGIRIEKLGFTPQKLGDLIYYEGPLLSLFRDKDDENVYYLYKWVDNNDETNRWVIVEASLTLLQKFLYGLISLRELILDRPICYIVNLDDSLTETEVCVSSTRELPAEYLPAEKSFFHEGYTEFAHKLRYDLLRILNALETERRKRINISLLHFLFLGDIRSYLLNLGYHKQEYNYDLNIESY